MINWLITSRCLVCLVYWQALEDQKPGAWGLVDVPFEDATLDKVRYTSGYYAMMQLSKYIKKGICFY